MVDSQPPRSILLSDTPEPPTQPTPQTMAEDEFDREDITFHHAGEYFIYVFQRNFDSGVITIRRIRSPEEPKDARTEALIYPNGSRQHVHQAIIALFKSKDFPSLDSKSFLPVALRKILQIFSTKEALMKNAGKAIQAFPSKSQIGRVEDLVDFLLPYTKWDPHGTSSRPIVLDNGSPRSSTFKTEATPTAGSKNTSSSCSTSSASPTGSANSPTPLKQSTPITRRRLLTVLSQPASLKRKLDSDADVGTSATEADLPSSKVRVRQSESPDISLIRLISESIAKKQGQKASDSLGSQPDHESTEEPTSVDNCSSLVVKLCLDKTRLADVVSDCLAEPMSDNQQAEVTDFTHDEPHEAQNLEDINPDTAHDTEMACDPPETPAKRTESPTRQVEHSPTETQPVRPTPRKIVISLPDYQPPIPNSPTGSSLSIDSRLTDSSNKGPSISPRSSVSPPLDDVSDALATLLAQKRALGLRQLKELEQRLKEEEQAIRAFALPLERRVVKLQRFCTEELERSDVLQARYLEAEATIKDLKGCVQRCQLEIQEIGEARDAAETQLAKTEQDLQMTVKVRAREQEESRKSKEEHAEEVRKLKAIVDEKTKENAALKEAWRTVGACYEKLGANISS